MIAFCNYNWDQFFQRVNVPNNGGKMRILLTGGSGSVGKAVVDRLVNHQHTVIVIGRRTDIQIDGAQYQVCDINDYPSLREVIRGCDAVVHLAAIPNPGVTSPEELFRINCAGTFNVFQAAAEEGIRRVVQASSINAAGQFYGCLPAPLHYLPLDEEHPVFSSDAYSFSKHVIEETGEYFWRRDGISSVALRLPWVAPAHIHATIGQRRDFLIQLSDKLLQRSRDERRAWFDEAWKLYNDFRATRPYEKPGGFGYRAFNDMPEEIRAKVSAMGSRVNFFTMLDERDSAQAIEKGLSAEFSGAHTLFINDHLNWTGIPSADLAQLYYPDVPMFRSELRGCTSLVSIAKARRLIGFEPEFTFGEG